MFTCSKCVYKLLVSEGLYSHKIWIFVPGVNSPTVRPFFVTWTSRGGRVEDECLAPNEAVDTKQNERAGFHDF